MHSFETTYHKVCLESIKGLKQGSGGLLQNHATTSSRMDGSGAQLVTYLRRSKREALDENKICCQFSVGKGREHGTRHFFRAHSVPPRQIRVSLRLLWRTDSRTEIARYYRFSDPFIRPSIYLSRSPAERKSCVKAAASSAFLLPWRSIAWESSRWTALTSFACSSLHLL